MSLNSNSLVRNYHQHPQITAWLSDVTSDLPVAFCLRWTHACATQRRLFDEASCSRDLGYFWNSVDRMLYGDDWKTKKLKRLITLERTDGTSWHAHGLCSAANYTTNKMKLMLSEKWLRHIKISDSNRHTHKHLVWVDEDRGDYGAYILKHIDGTRRFGNVGVIDAQNTFLGDKHEH